MKKVSKKIAQYLGKEQHLSEGQVQVISYGIETFFTMIIGYLAIFLVAYLIGSLKPTIIICILSFILRSFSGGGHCSSWQRCTISGALTVPFVGWLSEKIIISPQSLSGLWWLGIILVFSLILKYAPKDNPAKPIVTSIHRRRLKLLSLGFVLVLVIFSFYLSPGLTSMVFYGLIWQTLSIAPLGVAMINNIDKGLQKFIN